MAVSDAFIQEAEHVRLASAVCGFQALEKFSRLLSNPWKAREDPFFGPLRGEVPRSTYNRSNRLSALLASELARTDEEPISKHFERTANANARVLGRVKVNLCC